MLNPKRFIILAWLLQWQAVVGSTAQQHPKASLEQATEQIVCNLDIERYKDLNEQGLQAEYEWTLDMARICLANSRIVRDDDGCHYAIEFQRHAGRTALYRGLGEQAIEDYETAIYYVRESASCLEDPGVGIGVWEEVILRDIANAYLLVGAYELSTEISNVIMERSGKQGENLPGSAVDLDRLGRIAQQEGRFMESVHLQERAVRAAHCRVSEYLERYPELRSIQSDQSWAVVVRHPDVKRSLALANPEDKLVLTDLREVYYPLARALRLNGQLGDAEHALETAQRTPWVSGGTYRESLDLYVDRESALLAFARGEAAEALGKAEDCLDKYVMSPAEEVELLDLVSQAKEALGDLGGAMGALEAAIEIVETRRANLVRDEFKQSYAAGYAELYRRALDLAVKYEGRSTKDERGISRRVGTAHQSQGQGPKPEARSQKPEARSQKPEAHPADHESRTTNHAFQWAERVKGRAMLDAINRYDKRMARAVSTSDTAEMQAVRDLSSKVVSISDLRNAKWWPADTALLEFAYGGSKVRITKYEVRKREKSERSGDPDLSRSKTQSPKSKSEQVPTHEARSTDRDSRVYLWVVTENEASFHRLAISGRELDELSSSLTAALQQRGDRWVEPATQLYEHTIKPIADRLRGIKQLVIVGDGKLRTVPFEVLVAKRDAIADRAIPHKLLIEDYAIGYAPSATVLDVISKSARPAAWKHSLWAFASTQFGGRNGQKSKAPNPMSKWEGASSREPRTTNHESRITSFRDILRSARSLSLNDLPYTRREVDQVVRFFPHSKTKIWIDQPNMKHVLLAAGKKGDLRAVRFLHFATHAIVDESRPYLAGLILSPPYANAPDDGNSSTTTPTQPGGQDRGIAKSKPVEQAASQKTLDSILNRDRSRWSRPELLTLHELAELDLRSELVVLSACQSIGKRHIEGDWINGLARAFLMAGSSGVLCTLWETGDLLSAAVIPAIYDVMLSDESASPNINVPRALQQYKKSVLDSPRLGHPANWAPFIYHGKVAPRNDP